MRNKEKNKRKNTLKIFFEIVALIVFIGLTVFLFVSALNPTVKDSLSYKETGDTDYFVYLKPNNYFKEEVLPKNMQYIASLIDHINLKFDYTFNTTKKFNYEYKYYVTAKVIATDRNDSSKVIFENEEILLNEITERIHGSNSFVVNPVLNIDYNRYNDIMNSFKTDYGLLMDSNLVITLHINLSGEFGKESHTFSTEQTQQVVIPLSEQTLNITFSSKKIDNTDKILVYSENKFIRFAYLVLSFLSLVVSVIFGLNLANEISKKLDKKSEYTKTINKIMKEYDRIIVNSNTIPDVSDLEVIDVTSFDEILDARESIQRPIVFTEISKGKKAWFIIIGDKVAYRYVLTSTNR